MSMTREEVAQVALLARLRLTSQELDTFTTQLSSIVDFVAHLQELDTEGVEPLAHGIDRANVFRDDVRGPALATRRRPRQRPQAQRSELPRARRARLTAHPHDHHLTRRLPRANGPRLPPAQRA